MQLDKVKQFNTDQRIWSIDWHPQADLIASVGQGRSIKLWKMSQQDGWYLHTTIPTSHTKSIRCVKFNHKGNSLALASFDSTISIFMKGQQGFEELTVLEGHQNEVKSVSWSPNDNKLASCSRDRNVWIWAYNGVSMDFECETILQGHEDDVKSVIWLDNDLLASASYDTTVRLWAQEDGEFVPFQQLEGHTSTVWSLVYDEKTSNLYSSDEQSKIIRWSKQNATGRFQKAQVLQNIHLFPIFSLTLLSPDVLVTGSGDNSLALVVKGEVTSRGQHQGDVNCVAAQGDFVASGSDDEKLMIWKVTRI